MSEHVFPPVTDRWATSPPHSGTPAVVYAGLGRRTGAFLIDCTLASLISFVLAGFLLVAVGLAFELLPGQTPDWVTRGTLTIGVLPVNDLHASLPEILQEVALGAYFVWFWVRQAATPGMHVLGIEVLGAHDGEPLSFVQALRRFVVLRLCFFLLGLPLLLAARDSRRQGPHDKVAGTVVVQR